MRATVKGLFRGKIQTFEPSGERTGIYKEPIDTAVVSKLGLVGDEQADRRYHGGEQKALHQFSEHAYESVSAKFPLLRNSLKPGSFGENLSSDSLSELNVFIGDVYRVNKVLLQVSEPRKPCWKINQKFNTEGLSVYVEQQCVTGWYYRVLEKGIVSLDDTIELEERFNEDASIARFTQIATQHRPAIGDIRRLATFRGLSPSWQKRLGERLNFLASLIR